MITTYSVNLGNTSIGVPVFRSSELLIKPRILITAGLDGDEYASIDAAYHLISNLSKQKLNGSVVIIPIVNIPGFNILKSYNPLDNKYPKLVFPGNPKGTSTEQLIRWLDREYVSKADVWIDLHGGGLTEHLNPYMYVYETGIKEIDNSIHKIVRYAPLSKAVCRKKGAWDKTSILAKRGIPYYFIEAGSSGQRTSSAVKIHLETIQTILIHYGLIFGKLKTKEKKIYSKTSEYRTKQSGLWYPNFKKNGIVRKGDYLGTVRSLDQKILGTVIAGEMGEWLWYLEGLRCNTGDYLCEVAHGEIK